MSNTREPESDGTIVFPVPPRETQWGKKVLSLVTIGLVIGVFWSVLAGDTTKYIDFLPHAEKKKWFLPWYHCEFALDSVGGNGDLGSRTVYLYPWYGGEHNRIDGLKKPPSESGPLFHFQNQEKEWVKIRATCTPSLLVFLDVAKAWFK